MAKTKKPKGYKKPNKSIMGKMRKKMNAPANFGGGDMGAGVMVAAAPMPRPKRKKKARK